MNPASHHLQAKSQNGTIVLSTLQSSAYFYLVGASCPTSVLEDSGRLQSLVITPEPERQDVVAVATYWPKSRYETEHDVHLLCVDSKGEVIIDLANEFTLLPGRIGQLMGEGESAELVVTVQGQVVVHSPYALHCGKVSSLTTKGYSVVGEGGGTLLCRYLIGEVSESEVLNAVVARPNEESVFEQLAEWKRQAGEHVLERAQLLDRLKVADESRLQDCRDQKAVRGETEKYAVLLTRVLAIADGTEPNPDNWVWNSSQSKIKRILRLLS